MPNCVDLFAGAGGFSLGALQAGYRVELAVEQDRHAAATYRANVWSGSNVPKLVEGDIRRMSPDTLRREGLRGARQCDLLLGGPPCQGFSTHRLNDAGVADRRNDLIHVYFEFVRVFEPSAFLMENVPGMLWPRHKDTLARFYEQAGGAGYEVFQPVVLDARDYGVPQRRKRVFLLGLRRGADRHGLSWPPAPTHVGPRFGEGSAGLQPWKACGPAFDPPPADDPNDVHMRHNEELVEAFRRTPPNGGSRAASGRVLKCHAGHDGHGDVYGRIDPGGPAPTMTTACINPSKGRFVHPTSHHGITVRQAARIQTFPDTFVFHGGLMSAGEQVGNAVPVELARHLLTHLRPFLASVAAPIARDCVSSRPRSHHASPNPNEPGRTNPAHGRGAVAAREPSYV